MKRSRLADATSPYLQQHADNPVDWWPWSEEALALARQENKPILLSIGYSACHWCHVMAHESFEDTETAELMNALYVNIKVDREERPDLDRIYQTAHQLLARRAGGWPLTVFLTPDDQTPFFAGTYFPPTPRHGLPSFRDLLQQIARAYEQQRDAIDDQNASLRDALARLDAASGGQPTEIDAEPVHEAAHHLKSQFDGTHGGFGGAPKFPHPGTLRFLLREGTRGGDATARHLALHTLEKMASGGINDHLGGGFCRYSVDEQWMIPHFEKMLYDNGQLLALYAEAWVADGQRPLFRHICERTAEWVMREMQSPLGGFYASLDADSEGEEGRFYVWSRDEVAGLLTEEEYRVFAARFGLDRPPNFEGRWHLHTFADTNTISEKTGLSAREVRRRLLAAREKLLGARDRRVRPGRDEKILTSWNALMIKGMTVAGRLLGRADWIDSAVRALDYLLDRHWVDGRLLASSRDGEARLNAYLDDYAFLLDAVLELLQVRWNSDWFELARALADRLLTHFADRENGGFFFTSDDHEKLVHRPRPLADDAMPSGNSVAIEGLQTLAAIGGDMALHQAAEQAVRAAWPLIARSPYAHVGLLEGLHNHLEPPETVILRGTLTDLAEWQTALAQVYKPGRRVFPVPADASGLPTALGDKPAVPGRTLAFRCAGFHCEPPVDSIDAL